MTKPKERLLKQKEIEKSTISISKIPSIPIQNKIDKENEITAKTELNFTPDHKGENKITTEKEASISPMTETKKPEILKFGLRNLNEADKTQLIPSQNSNTFPSPIAIPLSNENPKDTEEELTDDDLKAIEDLKKEVPSPQPISSMDVHFKKLYLASLQTKKSLFEGIRNILLSFILILCLYQNQWDSYLLSIQALNNTSFYFQSNFLLYYLIRFDQIYPQIAFYYTLFLISINAEILRRIVLKNGKIESYLLSGFYCLVPLILLLNHSPFTYLEDNFIFCFFLLNFKVFTLNKKKGLALAIFGLLIYHGITWFFINWYFFSTITKVSEIKSKLQYFWQYDKAYFIAIITALLAQIYLSSLMKGSFYLSLTQSSLLSFFQQSDLNYLVIFKTILLTLNIFCFALITFLKKEEIAIQCFVIWDLCLLFFCDQIFYPIQFFFLLILLFPALLKSLNYFQKILLNETDITYATSINDDSLDSDYEIFLFNDEK